MILRKKKKKHNNKTAKPRKNYSDKEIKKDKNKLSIWQKLFVIFLANPFGWIFIILIFAYGKDITIDTFGTKTRAVITSRLSTSSRGDASQEFIYEFEYNGKKYEGNSRIDSKRRDRIGDHVDVVFFSIIPSINKPVDSSSIY